MKNLNLCVDIDGTVTEPYYWLDKANEYFSTNLKPKDVTEYEIHKMLGVSREAFIHFYEIFGQQIHLDSKVRFGAKEMVNRLYRTHNVHFVTAREEKMEDVTIKWLNRNGFRADSLSLLGTGNKVPKARELSSDFFIEDCHENAVVLAEAGFNVLLIDCTYNQKPVPKQVIRIKNWWQIVKIIDQCNYPNAQNAQRILMA
jgi:hypothetical protein